MIDFEQLEHNRLEWFLEPSNNIARRRHNLEASCYAVPSQIMTQPEQFLRNADRLNGSLSEVCISSTWPEDPNSPLKHKEGPDMIFLFFTLLQVELPRAMQSPNPPTRQWSKWAVREPIGNKSSYRNVRRSQAPRTILDTGICVDDVNRFERAALYLAATEGQEQAWAQSIHWSINQSINDPTSPIHYQSISA